MSRHNSVFFVETLGFCWIGLLFFFWGGVRRLRWRLANLQGSDSAGESSWFCLRKCDSSRLIQPKYIHTFCVQQKIIHDYQMEKHHSIIILSTYFYIMLKMHYVSDPKKPLNKKPSGHARSQQRTVAKSNETGAVGKAYWPVVLGKRIGLLRWESHPEAR